MANQMITLAQRVLQQAQASGGIPNQNAPWAQAGISAIMNGDAQTGQQIANNLCQSYGLTPDQAVNQVLQRIKLPF